MKNILSKLSLLFISLALVFTISSCKKNDNITRMQVDINPSIELMVDSKNKVISATALNDDGSIILSHEIIVGKTPEQAVEIIITAATDTGYIVSGNVEAGENTVSISVSGNTKAAKKLYDKCAKEVNNFFNQHDIKGKVEKAEALKIEELRKIAYNNSTFTEEEINNMSEEDLYKTIAVGRIETAELVSQELKEAYFRAKAYEIKFAENEATANVIKEMGTLYQVAYSGYSAALDSYNQVIKSIDDYRYNTLVSPDSEYQKTLVKLRDAKEDILAKKTLMANVEVDGEVYLSVKAELQIIEETYNALLETYIQLGDTANAYLESLVASLQAYEETLRAFKDTLPPDITEKLNAKAKDVEADVNKAKDEFFAKFEEAHKEDIQKFDRALQDRKQQLIDEVRANQNPKAE